ncbi:nucleic-acid-binding protein from mobile element jockey-like [Drosophila madeirensis]|uniref:Nucleic-acid-binding protein from mobile element jockey-like n=1 Tax=Drosophila madeirensis TaxID=30013 RepID=A0AAU9G568_DROMD
MFTSAIAQVIGAGKEFTYRATSNNNIRVMTNEKTSYTALKKYLDETGKRYQTFQPRDERPYRVVIKGLHYSTEIEDIKAALRSQGHVARDVRNLVNKSKKQRYCIFFVNLKPASNNKEAFNIKTICHSVVTVEPPLKFDDVVQCYRCQRFGHTKRYCRLEERCVKCGGDHASNTCDKGKNDPALCLFLQGMSSL